MSDAPLRKTKRRKKDPTAPKKPLTAFVYFGQTTRPKLLAEKPGMKFTEIGAEIGKLWSALSDVGKVSYEQKAEADKLRYKQEMISYVPDAAFLQSLAKKGVQRLKKDPAKPKRSRSAYLVFCDKHRPGLQKEHVGKSMTDIAGDLAKMWNAVSTSEKKECDQIAATEKKEYVVALEKYTPSEEFVRAKQSLEAARKAEKDKIAGEKSKVKEKLAKCKTKVKELQADIHKTEKAMAAAEKVQAKLPQLRADLAKSEAKLAELLGE
eukprot:TRINITY_DN16099_c0_g1_i1.p1 TRINITY_DN16099_c0_g1~~TRINITY_DN16099_c0_g1_i1.p1  ORF type:complete len:265 (+),score=76.97 TRINITY_DN16099_c0_g1_i1:173-967(+)